jgi:cytochrome b561
MRALNGEPGYGWVTRLLHWVTLVLLVGQFVLGYAMKGLGEWLLGEGEGHGHGSGHGDDQLVFVHAALGVMILVLALVRIGWRLSTPLPPWDERLSELDRRLERFAELALYSLLLIIPTTGLALLFFSGKERELRSGEWQPPFELVDDDLLLGLHIAAHIAFYVALLVHVGIALRRRTLTRIF